MMKKTLVLTGKTKHKRKKVKELFKKAKKEVITGEETIVLEILETMILKLVSYM